MVTTPPSFKKFTEGNARKFTVSFAFCAHVDVIKIEKHRSFPITFKSIRHQRACNVKAIGSHLKLVIKPDSLRLTDKGIKASCKGHNQPTFAFMVSCSSQLFKTHSTFSRELLYCQ